MEGNNKRSLVLDQLSYLVDEIEALKKVIHRVPEPILVGRPTGSELSIKELYGIIAAADERVFPDYVKQIADGEKPRLSIPDDEALAQEEDWQSMPVEDILKRVQHARRRLVENLESLPEGAWHQTATAEEHAIDLSGLGRYIVRRDTAVLRIAGTRLHESHLTDRPRDLPK